MTGFIGCVRTLVMTAFTVCGVLVAQTGFDGGSVDTASKAGTGSEARLSTDDAKSALSANAGASPEADVAAHGLNECTVNCLAPCANGCASPASLSVEGDAELQAVVSAFAPENSCGCPNTGQALHIDASADAGIEAGVSSEDGEASTWAEGSLTTDAGFATGAVSGTATIDVD